MTKAEVTAELEEDEFTPIRLHMVSGKTVDVLGPNAAHTLTNALLVLRNPTPGTRDAEGYDVVAYHNIERFRLASVRSPSVSPHSLRPVQPSGL